MSTSRIIDKFTAAIVMAPLLFVSGVRYFKPELINFDAFLYYALEMLGLVILGLVCVLTYRTLKPEESTHLLRREGIQAHAHDPLLTLRAFACMTVLLGHGLIVTFVPQSLKLALWKNSPFYGYFLPEPWLGVWIFFTLSGYLMGKGFFKQRYSPTTLGVGMYYRNRFLRIYPIYAISTIVVGLLNSPGLFSLSHFMNSLNLFVLFDLENPTVQTIGAFGSIGVEMEYYLYVPLLYILTHNFLLTRHYRWLPFVGVVLGGLVLRLIVKHNYGGPFLANFDLFLGGFCLNPIVMAGQKKPAGGSKILGGLVLMLMLYCIAAYCCWHGRMLQEQVIWTFLEFWMPSVSLVMVGTTIVLMETASLQSEQKWVRSFIKHTQLFGLLTYAAYACHSPIYEAAKNMLGPMTSMSMAVEVLAVNLLVVLAVSYCLYRFIEIRFDKKKRVEVHVTSTDSPH